jgi:hypothetical protein
VQVKASIACMGDSEGEDYIHTSSERSGNGSDYCDSDDYDALKDDLL